VEEGLDYAAMQFLSVLRGRLGDVQEPCDDQENLEEDHGLDILKPGAKQRSCQSISSPFNCASVTPQRSRARGQDTTTPQRPQRPASGNRRYRDEAAVASKATEELQRKCEAQRAVIEMQASALSNEEQRREGMLDELQSSTEEVEALRSECTLARRRCKEFQHELAAEARRGNLGSSLRSSSKHCEQSPSSNTSSVLDSSLDCSSSSTTPSRGRKFQEITAELRRSRKATLGIDATQMPHRQVVADRAVVIESSHKLWQIEQSRQKRLAHVRLHNQ